MKPIYTEELKRIQFDILKDVDSFCKKNGIRYSLAYGTLLGAVRHKGYIPWDDDIDIMLLRSDYEKFIRIYGNERYSIDDTSTNENYFCPYAKVIDNRTVLKENTAFKSISKVFIDVFPVDNIPDSESELNAMFRKKSIWNAIFNLKKVTVSKKRTLIKNITLAISHVLLSVLPMRMVVEKMKQSGIRYSNQETKRRAVFVTADNKKRWILPSKLFEEYTELVFEGYSFSVVSRYDDYLTACYGDYMKLPPIEQQTTHHSIEAWWAD